MHIHSVYSHIFHLCKLFPTTWLQSLNIFLWHYSFKYNNENIYNTYNSPSCILSSIISINECERLRICHIISTLLYQIAPNANSTGLLINLPTHCKSTYTSHIKLVVILCWDIMLGYSTKLGKQCSKYINHV